MNFTTLATLAIGIGLALIITLGIMDADLVLRFKSQPNGVAPGLNPIPFVKYMIRRVTG